MRDSLELTAKAEQIHFWFRGFRAFVTPIIKQIADGRRDLRIIDCGCGTGYNLTTLLRPFGRPVAFDLAVHAIHRARRSGLPLVRASVNHIPFRSNTFDLATSFDVLQSVPDDEQAIRELARVIKPGGYVLLNVVALAWLKGDHSEFWKEQRRYTRASAARLLKSAGLRPVRISFLFASLVPMMLAVRTMQRVLRPWRRPHGDADLRVPAASLNTVLTWLVKSEVRLANFVPMPFGSSLVIVGRKP